MITEGRLMITRKSGESIRIISGEHTTIITLTMDGSRMRVSIQAPKAVKIYREELIIKPKALEGAI
jgi:carbon storage regulator CsrA